MTHPDVYGDVPHVPTDYQPPTMPTLAHPNRNANSVTASPTGAQVRRARMAAGMTAGEAGELVYERAQRWLKFENDEARMHPAVWELWQQKVGTLDEADNEPVAVGDLGDLARAVYHSDGYVQGGTVGAIREVLDTALRTRLGGRRAAIDLGNGHSLVCHTRENVE